MQQYYLAFINYTSGKIQIGHMYKYLYSSKWGRKCGQKVACSVDIKYLHPHM